MIQRAYYANSIPVFLADSETAILGQLTQHHDFALEDLQKAAWLGQIRILKSRFADHPDLAQHIYFEFAIPRMGKRVDVVLLRDDTVFVLEFKVGDIRYPRAGLDQVVDYALDLKNFHAESHAKPIVPVLVATRAPNQESLLEVSSDGVYAPLKANADNFAEVIAAIPTDPARRIDPRAWQDSTYKPTPTIIEAAQALYRGHSVQEISRADSGAINLTRTAYAISDIVERSKREGQKSICFVTGVPGAGKTLAGLNIANERHQFEEEEHAVFLSGNRPLVEVLQEALARNSIEEAKIRGHRISKSEALRRSRAFIQNIHHFRDAALSNEKPPIERVAVFDEAQRAWTLEQTTNFMKQKKGQPDFDKSEPEFLIEVMDRHKDWAVIICLIGGGQEINRGEAGLPEWFNALKGSFLNWHVYASDQLTDFEYTLGDPEVLELPDDRKSVREDLHLGVSVRSFRSERQSAFVKALLDNKPDNATQLYFELKARYPILVTRDLEQAKAWLKAQARGSERYGVVASSGGNRLRPVGINVKAKIEPKHWFLNDKCDVRSSYYLEEVATEFDIQGLELDWVCVAWDGNFTYAPNGWIYRNFSGTKWQNINEKTRKLYLKNAYRVLLTRARQGLVIFVPEGDEEDPTRPCSYYDPTFRYLRRVGIPELVDYSGVMRPSAFN